MTVAMNVPSAQGRVRSCTRRGAPFPGELPPDPSPKAKFGPIRQEHHCAVSPAVEWKSAFSPQEITGETVKSHNVVAGACEGMELVKGWSPAYRWVEERGETLS